jgi:CheY-like chemotaxis protein
MKKILIIEDETVLIKILEEKLVAEKLKVLKAKNGKEGLATALAEKPDLILLDIVMPVMDGIAMLKKLRKDPWGETAKVIILTNLINDETISKSEKLNVSNYLIKSDWKLVDLVDKVKKQLKN